MAKKERKVVFGVDPGVNNLGWCITNHDGSIAGWGLLTETLPDMKKSEDIVAFRKNMLSLIKGFNLVASSCSITPDFVMERYMPRGMRRGNQAERINVIIGYLLGTVKYKDAYMLPASQWKQRREKEYTEVMNDTIPDHIVDTYTMTLYYLEKIKGVIDSREVKRRLRAVKERDWGWKKKKGEWYKEP